MENVVLYERERHIGLESVTWLWYEFHCRWCGKQFSPEHLLANFSVGDEWLQKCCNSKCTLERSHMRRKIVRYYEEVTRKELVLIGNRHHLAVNP